MTVDPFAGIVFPILFCEAFLSLTFAYNGDKKVGTVQIIKKDSRKKIDPKEILHKWTSIMISCNCMAGSYFMGSRMFSTQHYTTLDTTDE